MQFEEGQVNTVQKLSAVTGQLTVPGLLNILSMPRDKTEIINVVVEYKHMSPAPNVCPCLTAVGFQYAVCGSKGLDE